MSGNLGYQDADWVDMWHSLLPGPACYCLYIDGEERERMGRLRSAKLLEDGGRISWAMRRNR